jgi:hypothetical protein
LAIEGEELMSPQVASKGISITETLRTVPCPDYDHHPAYGRCFPKASFSFKLKALGTLIPWIVFVAVRRLLVFDRLHALPHCQNSTGLMGRLLNLPRYTLPVLTGWVGYILTRFRAPQRAATRSEFSINFERDGFAAMRMSDQEMDGLLRFFSEPISRLVQRRNNNKAQTFDDNQEWLDITRNREVFDYVTKLLEQNRIIEAASDYFKRQARVTHLLLQANDARDTYFHNAFSDVGLPDSPTNYMHLDASYDTLKCAIYLTEVAEANGPFCFVIGSHKLKDSWFAGLIRRAVDRSGLASYNRNARQLFMALPKSWRLKGPFGSEFLESQPIVSTLLECEHRFTSQDGNLGMFDNLGIHRGGLVLEGERRVLFVTLT